MLNREKEQRAISYLKNFEPTTEPYYLCYSGGKDSDTIRILADLAGVNYECHNNHTTVDAPETVFYIRNVMSQYGEMRIEHDPKDGHKIYRYGDRGFVHLHKTMWKLIEECSMPPTRVARYCCEKLKENGGTGRRKITGVRWAESPKRKANHDLVTVEGKPKTIQKTAQNIGADYKLSKWGHVLLNTDNDESRRVVESCYRTVSTLINPIIDWTDSEVWDFLRYYGCESNPLYKKGYYRIGCIGCPLSGSKNMLKDFARYPTYKRAYIRAFEKIVSKGKESKHKWKTGEDVFNCWLHDGMIPGQLKLDLGEDYE